MIKYLFTCLLLFTVLLAIGQPKKSVVNLISSDRAQGTNRNGLVKVYNGVFRQDYSTLRSDSAYFYPNKNSFEAFGHVNINQGDTLNIFSDKLNYNGNTHIAILTDNVKMVDKDATLTTNYLTYNTATRIGTYTGGGKLVNKDNTLTSTNGYYFAFSRDSYFRYNVTLLTVDATIKTDTLRYNTNSRIAYFYGPTHIYGKKKDTLYTENGTYNTVTEQAFFGKKNLYTQDTKSLKGDSLFYDRLKGYGRAVKNVVFDDREQKITLHGQLGTYYSADQRTVVTRNPWVTIITEEKDSTKTDTVKKQATVNKKGKPVVKPAPNTKPVTTLGTPASPDKNIAMPPVREAGKQRTDTAQTDTSKKLITKINKPVLKPGPGTKPVTDISSASPGTQKNNRPAAGKLTDSTNTKVQGKEKLVIKPALKDTGRVKRDTIYMVADTLETRIITFKDLKTLQERRRLLNDTSAAARRIVAAERAAKNPSKFLSVIVPKIPTDTTFMHRDYFGKPKPAPKRVNPNARNNKKAPADTTKRLMRTDSVNLTHKYTLSDTSHIRILVGHFNAKIYKSDLQAKADSIFYSSGDSTIRCYVHPMLWSQGSQMSGDTIYLQMKNKKLDNMDIFPSAFIVNTEKEDTTHFNQIAGKKMKGYFADNKLSRMFVSGNAESIYFQRDSLGTVTDMQRSLSSLIRANFKSNELQNLKFEGKPEHRDGPVNKFKEDDLILKGFIWKPRDRPESKEQIIPELDKQHKYKHNAAPPKSSSGTVTAKGKSPADTHTKPAVKDSAGTAVKGKPVEGVRDSSAVQTNKQVKTAAKDSVKTETTNTSAKPAAVKPAAAKPAFDENGRRIIRNVIIQPAPSTAPILVDTLKKKP